MLLGEHLKQHEILGISDGSGYFLLDQTTAQTIINGSPIFNVGLRTNAAVLPSTATNGITLYNTADETTNYEKGLINWQSNLLSIETANGGTGTSRRIQMVARSGSNNTYLRISSSVSPNFLFSGTASTFVTLIASNISLAASSGNQDVLSLTNPINQSGTASYRMLLINPTETTTGSGTKLLADFQVGSVSKFSVNNSGTTTINGATVDTYLKVGSNASGYFAGYKIQASGLDRWGIFRSRGTETGSNVESDLVIAGYSDAGAYINDYCKIIRSTGQLRLLVAGSTAGLVIGGDAQLYKSAASTLKTPGSFTVTGNLYLDAVSSRIGLGVAPTSIAALFLKPTFTDTATTLYGHLYNVTINGSNTAYNAFYDRVNIATGVTLTNRYSLFVENPTLVGTGAVTNNYGVYIANQTAGTANNAIYFAGTGVGNGLSWSTDVKLYKSAAAMLYASSAMSIYGDLHLLLNGSQDYMFTNRGNNLAIQGQSSATATSLEFFSKDGDGTDIVGNILWGVGTPSAVTNAEFMQFSWRPADSAYVFRTSKAGTGTVRPLIFDAQGGATFDQLVLNIDGTISAGSTISATGYKVGATAGIDATVALAKITALGADGSLTVTKGIITAYTAPT